MIKTCNPFPMGRTLATPGAHAALADAGEDAHSFLARHSKGDWGQVDEHDWQANDESLVQGLRLLSVYQTKKGVKLWVITEADRSATTILLPEEY